MYYVVMWRHIDVPDNETRMVFPFSEQGFADACEKFREKAYEEAAAPVLYVGTEPSRARNVE